MRGYSTITFIEIELPSTIHTGVSVRSGPQTKCMPDDTGDVRQSGVVTDYVYCWNSYTDFMALKVTRQCPLTFLVKVGLWEVKKVK